MEEELIVVKEKVEEVNWLKLVLIVNMNYEICILLNVIVGFVFLFFIIDDEKE